MTEASDSEAGGKKPSLLWRIVKWLDDYFEYWLNFVFYTFLTWIIVIEVVRRYAFDSATTYGEEVARYSFIWLAYVAAARGVKFRTHLSIDILPLSVGRTARFWLFMLNDACFMALALVVIYTSVGFVQTTIQYGQLFQGIDIPYWVAVSSIPVGWTLIAIRIIQRNIRTINDFRAGRPIQSGFLGST